MTVLAHVGGTLGPSGEVVLAGAVLGLAAWADRRGRAGGVLPTRRRVALWVAAVAVLVSAVGPLEAAAHESFAWHMVQHLVLLLVVAPALVLARPDLVGLRALPGGTRRVLSIRARRAAPPWPLGPVMASVALALWLWVGHSAAVYGAQMDSAVVHALEHAVWVASGAAVWTVLLRQRPSTARRVLTPLLTLVVVMPATSILTLVLLGEDAARFDHYAGLGAAAALADQRLGAGIMWAGMAVVLLVWSLVVIGTSEPRERVSPAGLRARDASRSPG